ncbi:MAG: bifunctional diaminohydroxyphosphoribosylaminopyrimidine deaminase/5-amino-6-(5-phosphoribosylamino)uracil reductase RibD [Steroidobacteraceae bacterium]
MNAREQPDLRHMEKAIELAHRGLWTTDPNPRVGCVIADGERVIAEGWHERAGLPHAEAAALAVAGEAARGATAYVTLEPCCHHGRTPPCADALIAAGIKRVCYAIPDPNPRVSGGGASRLAAAGIEVSGGLLADAARALNPGFLSRMERGRPWLRLKMAASLDGRTALANGESRWITGDVARADVQQLRARSSALMTGAATVRCDDPRLDVRLPEATRQPLRVVLDTQLRTSPSARIVPPPGQLLVLTASEDKARRMALEDAGAQVAVLPAGPGGLDLAAAMRHLAGLEVNELQAECGPTLAGALLSARLVDELVLYLAPALLGMDARPLASLPGIASMSERMEFSISDLCRVGRDLRVTLRPAEA